MGFLSHFIPLKIWNGTKSRFKFQEIANKFHFEHPLGVPIEIFVGVNFQGCIDYTNNNEYKM